VVIELDPSSRRSVGATLDAWLPRILKLLGLVAFAMSIVMAALGQFNPSLFGGSLVAASGGYVGDALHALRPGKEE
jgi:hypothetical protein